MPQPAGSSPSGVEDAPAGEHGCSWDTLTGRAVPRLTLFTGLLGMVCHCFGFGHEANPE